MAAPKAKWELVSPAGTRTATSDVALYWRLLGQGYTTPEDETVAPAKRSVPPAEPEPDEAEAAPEPEAKPKPSHKRRSSK